MFFPEWELQTCLLEWNICLPTLYIIVSSWQISHKTPEKNVFFPIPSPREILNVDHFLIRETVFIWREELSHPIQNNPYITQETRATQSSAGTISMVSLVPWEDTMETDNDRILKQQQQRTGDWDSKETAKEHLLSSIEKLKTIIKYDVQRLASRGHC